MSEEHGENEHEEAAKETQETEDGDEEEEDDDDDDDDDEQRSSKPDSFLDTKDLAKEAEKDRASSQRKAAELSRNFHEIVDLDALESKQLDEEEKFHPTQKPVRSLFWYGAVKATDKVSGSGSWMARKLSNIFTSIENWGTETLKKNAKWIGSIPFLGSWLLGKPEKTLEEREKEQKKEEEKNEKEAKAKNKEAARKVEAKEKEDERKLKSAVDKANKDFEKKKSKTPKTIEEKK